MKPAILNAGQNFHVRGGSDRYQMVLGDLLAAHGHEVIPFAASHPDNEPTRWSRFFPDSADFDRPGPVDLLRFVYSRPAAQSLRNLLREAQVDIAHLHIYYGKLTSSVLQPLVEAGIPIVQTLHEYKLICPVYTMVSGDRICEACAGTHYWRALPKRCNRGSVTRTALSVAEAYVSRLAGAWDKVDHFIGVSHFIREKMIQHGIPAEKISTIHNFIDASRFTPATGEGRYVLYFGRLERLKGIFTLLDAAEQVPDLHILLAGEGNARAELESAIEARGIRNVEILGFRGGTDLEELIRGSICTVLPAEWYENCPMSVLESFAYARPVIGTRIGGIPELIDSGTDGLLVEPNDAGGLAEGLRWMSDHRSDAVAMGLAARAKVESGFSAAVHYARIRAVYDRLL